MSERIENLQYQDAGGSSASPATGVATSLFADGPAEFLVRKVSEKLKGIEEWKALFGDFIDGYRRMDYPERALPVMRIYNNSFSKDFESWFVNGDILIDIIWPPSIRRQEQQQFQDSIAAAVVQQFRITKFFQELCDEIRGLNELGKRVTVDKSLGFEWQDGIVPLTQITVNFRIDLREWDRYLEETNRTKDSPFEVSIGDLKRMVSEFCGVNDDETVNVTVPADQRMDK